MAEAGDIVGISIPFTAGVAAAALVPAGPVRYFCALASLALACSMLAMTCLKGRRRVSTAILFFSLGALGLLSHETVFTGPGDVPAWISGAMGNFCALIDSIDFEDPRTGALMKALLTGRKDSLSPETIQIFRESGAAHILALSGLHLGVLYGIISRLLSVLGNSRAASISRSVVTVAAAAFYTVLTGASASIVRAFLFISMNEILRQCPGRRRNPLNILCSALMIQLTFDPTVIRSLSFQLSYLAMLGIFTIYPRLEKWYPESFSYDVPRKIWKSAALSLSCQVFTAPLVHLRFGTFPKYFLITNLMAMPLSELFITGSVVCLAGTAVGFCPDIMKSPVELIARTLIFCLETISTM